MQKLSVNKPINVNTDTNEALLKPSEASYLKNYRISFNKNQGQGNQEGGNFGVGTPYNSTEKAVNLLMPAGKNKCVGSKEILETNELYYFNWNSNGNHGIYRINGDTRTADIVMVDPKLNFSRDPKHFIAGHRVALKVIYQADETQSKKIKEMFLMFTNGDNWQYWVNVISAVKTQGFNAELNPYWALRAPHYDREEFFKYATRPPLFSPVATPLPVLASDKGKVNHLLNRSIQFAFRYIYTDGRTTTISPTSAPYILKDNPCTTSTDGFPRGVNLAFYAGSAMVEKIQIVQRTGAGDWYLYDTIERFPGSSLVLGDDYWTRENQWNDIANDQLYSYDQANNLVNYRYYGDRQIQLLPVSEATQIQTDLPVKSIALAAAGNAVLMANNLYGYDNLSREELKKFSFEVVNEGQDDAGETEMVKIRVMASIRSVTDMNYSQAVYHNGDDVRRFAGLEPSSKGYHPDRADSVEATLGEHEGLICYLAGTNYRAIGEQYYLDRTGMTKVGVLNMSIPDVRDKYFGNAIKGGSEPNVYLQVFDFVVPKGLYVARMARHGADLQGDYQKTSTFTQGLSLAKKPLTVTTDGVHEIVIDATAGDKNPTEVFSIVAPAFLGFSREPKIIEGYVREDSELNIPVENLAISTNHGIDKFGSIRTDHNGYYWIATRKNLSEKAEAVFSGIANCSSYRELFRTTVGKAGDHGGYYKQDLYLKEKLGTVDSSRILVRGKITQKDTGAGLSGMGVFVSGGAVFYTGSDGTFELTVHQGKDAQRKGTIYVVANGGRACGRILTEGVQLTYPFNSGQAPACGKGVVRVYPGSIDIQFDVDNKSAYTLKSDGRYGIGVVGWDLAGRSVYVQNLDYLDIPSLQAKGGALTSHIRMLLSNDVTFPDYVKYITLFRTENLTLKKQIQWVGDKITFLDIRGNETAGAGAVRAKINIQSLLDYNVENNFSTTVGYQFTPGDVMRIIDDGETIFSAESGYRDYQVLGTNFSETVPEETDTDDDDDDNDGKTLVIPFDSRLLDLKEKAGFWIEIRTPRDYSETESYGEIPGTYPVINGKLLKANSGAVLDTWDTYFVYRDIVVEDLNGKSIQHPFESSAISDFWGAGVPVTGRKHVRDDNAEQKWYINNVIKSDDIVNEGRVNGLGTFLGNQTNFKGSELAGIVAMFVQRNIIAFVCKNDWFLADYDMNYAKVTKTGMILANLDQNLGDPHQKVGSNYGCEYEDTATIEFYSFTGENGASDRMLLWADRKNSAVVAMNFSTAIDISGNNKSYFVNKFRKVTQFNKALPEADYLDNLFEIVAGIDPKGKTYTLTFRPRRGLSVSELSFINNERQINYGMQETFVLDLEQKAWAGWVGYTPEFYGRLTHSISGSELVSFVNGEPFFHNGNGTETYNVFYGIETDQVIEIVVNEDRDKLKLFQGIAVQSAGVPYFVDKVTTSTKNQFSYIPVKYFTKIQGSYLSCFLRNMNTYPSDAHPVNSMLIDGSGLEGFWAKVRLVRDTRQRTAYNELDTVRTWNLISSKK